MRRMDPQRWRRIKEIFSAALELDPAERPVFLEASCADDAALRAEVEALIAGHDAEGDFISSRSTKRTRSFSTGLPRSPRSAGGWGRTSWSKRSDWEGWGSSTWPKTRASDAASP